MIEQNEVALMPPENGQKMLQLEECVNGEMLGGLRPSDSDKFIVR